MQTKRSIIWGAIYALVAGSVAGPAQAQRVTTVEMLQASAKVYAGTDWPGTYTRFCSQPGPADAGPGPLPKWRRGDAATC